MYLPHHKQAQYSPYIYGTVLLFSYDFFPLTSTHVALLCLLHVKTCVHTVNVVKDLLK